ASAYALCFRVDRAGPCAALGGARGERRGFRHECPPSLHEVMNGVEAEKPDQDQVDRDDVVQESWDDQDQNASDEGGQWCYGGCSKLHGKSPCSRKSMPHARRHAAMIGPNVTIKRRGRHVISSRREAGSMKALVLSALAAASLAACPASA